MSEQKIKFHKSLKFKLGIYLSGFAVAVSLLVWIGIAYILGNQLEENLAGKSGDIARVVAFNLSAAVEFEDVDAAKSVIGNIAKDENVAYIIVLTEDKQSFAEIINTDKITRDQIMVDIDNILSSGELWSFGNDHVLMAYSPILQPHGEALGNIFIGYSVTEIEQVGFRIQVLAIVLCLLIIGGGLVTVEILSRKLLSPINRLADGLNRIKNGDLNVELRVTSTDELGMLTEDLNEMTSAIKNIIVNVTDASISVEDLGNEIGGLSSDIAASSQRQAEAVKGTSESVVQISHEIENISSASDDLFEKVTDTTSIIEEAAASIQQIARSSSAMLDSAHSAASTIEEMSRTMQVVSGRTKEVENLTLETASSADSGRRILQTMLENVQDIAVNINSSSEVMEELATSSKQIGEIVRVIEEIADQTNLLALNAAIEAARAGEAGRGFAVVADEIRNLADRSLKAAKQIGDLIKAAQTGSRKAVEVSSENAKNVLSGADTIQNTVETLDSILVGVENISGLLREVNLMVEEQKNAVEGVQMVVDSVRNSISEVAASTEEQERGSVRMLSSMHEATELTRTVNEAAAKQKLNGEMIVSTVSSLQEIADSLQEYSISSEKAVAHLSERFTELRQVMEIFKT
jgi:methyl-accepting chemotaxis protein